MMRLRLKDKDTALILREDGHMDFYVPTDDEVSEETQMMAAIAILYNGDKSFRKTLKKKWDDILKNGVKSKYLKGKKKG